jgi:galactose mutarotase-like enzyme
MPDREGNIESIVLRFPDLTGYIAHGNLYLGAIVGRTAGRIDRASFELNGAMYDLPKNDGENSLHGNGEFSTALWEAEVFDRADPNVCEHRQHVSVTFFRTSPAGANGFPGEVHAEVTYVLNNNSQFEITYRATTTEDTLFDPTNHTYFNLSGNQKADILSQTLIADVDRFVELRDDLIPTGNILPVDGTAFDFRLGEPFSQGRTSEHPQNIMVGHGYDHPFLFREDGIINNVLLSLNIIPEAVKWSVDPAVSKIPIILLSIWSSLGYVMIIYMAAIENVPKSLYEAATIDGASSFTQFIKITVPLISPTTFYLVIVRMIAVFKIFSSVNVFTMGSSITSNTSIVQEIYSSAFSSYEHGYASAQSVVLLVIILIITAIQFWGQKKWVHY